MSLSIYTELSLRDTHIVRKEAGTLTLKGSDLKIVRKHKQQAARLAGEHTFIAVYEMWGPPSATVGGKTAEHAGAHPAGV